MNRKITRVATLLAAALTTGLTLAAPASAAGHGATASPSAAVSHAAQADPHVCLTNSSRCQVDNGAGNQVTETQLCQPFPCGSNYNEQTTRNGYLMLSNASSGDCLRAHSADNKVVITNGPCSSGDPNDEWLLSRFGNNVYDLQNNGTGDFMRALDQTGAGVQHGACTSGWFCKVSFF